MGALYYGEKKSLYEIRYSAVGTLVLCSLQTKFNKIVVLH